MVLIKPRGSTSLVLFSLRRNSTAMSGIDGDNPLLKDFYFPPFDSMQAHHVRPGVAALLNKLVTILLYTSVKARARHEPVIYKSFSVLYILINSSNFDFLYNIICMNFLDIYFTIN